MTKKISTIQTQPFKNPSGPGSSINVEQAATSGMAAFAHSPLCINLTTGSFPPLTSTYTQKTKRRRVGFRSLIGKKREHSKNKPIWKPSLLFDAIRLIVRREKKSNRWIKTKINEYRHHPIYRGHMLVENTFTFRSFLQQEVLERIHAARLKVRITDLVQEQHFQVKTSVFSSLDSSFTWLKEALL